MGLMLSPSQSDDRIFLLLDVLVHPIIMVDHASAISYYLFSERLKKLQPVLIWPGIYFLE